jgi:hypothetical protein
MEPIRADTRSSLATFNVLAEMTENVAQTLAVNRVREIVQA